MIKIIILTLLLTPISLFADSFSRTWLGLFNKKEVAQNYSFWTEAQARMDNKKFDNQQLLLRFGVLKPLSPKNEVGLLYAHVKTGMTQENRLALQLSTKWENEFSLRQRLEFRQLEGTDAKSMRYRSLVRFQKNHLLIWDEPFFNITSEDWTRNRVFERNRFFIGVNLPFASMRSEIGYMHQFVPKKTRDDHEHIMALYLFY